MNTSLVPVNLPPEKSQFALTEAQAILRQYGLGFSAVDPLQAELRQSPR